MIKQLSASEVNYLALYIGMREVFGVEEELNEPQAMNSLLEKGIINKKNLPEKETVMLVESIRRYNTADYYIHFQNIVIAIFDKKWCIVKRKQEEEQTYQFAMAPIESGMRLLVAHPLIAYEVFKDLQLRKDSYLLIELFDKDKVLIDTLAMKYKEGQYYGLDTKLPPSFQQEKSEIVAWLLCTMEEEYGEIFKSVIKEVQNGGE